MPILRCFEASLELTSLSPQQKILLGVLGSSRTLPCSFCPKKMLALEAVLYLAWSLNPVLSNTALLHSYARLVHFLKIPRILE